MNDRHKEAVHFQERSAKQKKYSIQRTAVKLFEQGTIFKNEGISILFFFKVEKTKKAKNEPIPGIVRAEAFV